MLIAAGLAGAYAEGIPNFEILTLVAFCSGILLGARGGALVGGLTMLVYTSLNPYGPAHPFVMLAQVGGEAIAGLSGAAFAALGMARRPAVVRALGLGAVAAVVTLAYDLLTNTADGLVFGQIRARLLMGIPFSLWHIATNVALFTTLGTPLSAVFARYAERLSS